MPDPVGELLGRRMRSETDDVSLGPQLVPHIYADAVAARRRRRIVVSAGGGLVALVLAAAGAVATLGSRQPATTSAPTAPAIRTTTPATGSVQPARPYQWASTLPTDVSPQVPYVSHGVLFGPGFSYAIPSGDGGVVGRVRDGVVLHQFGTPAMATPYVVVSAGSARARPLPPPVPGAPGGAALSPDRARIAYGGRVVEVATGRTVARFPGDEKSVFGWLRPGIVYLDARGRARLWRPGTQPRTLPIRVSGAPGDGAVLLDTVRRSCGRVVEVSRTAILTTQYQACDDADPVGLSPRGTVVLTRGGQAVDLHSGHRAAVPIPLIEAAARGQVAWEDERTVVFPVYSRGGSRVRFVRCTTSTGACTLAGHSMRSYRSEFMR